MLRIVGLLSFLLCSIAAPAVVFAQQSAAICELDGSLVGAFITNETVLVTENEQPLSTVFNVYNESQTYAYGAVSVGVGLYETEDALYPAFWVPVSDNEFFPAGVRRSFAVELAVDYVTAGEYTLRIGVAQGSQLAAMAASRQTEGVAVTKTTPAITYPFTLSTIPEQVSVGSSIDISLVAENTRPLVVRDYEQQLVISRGTYPLGSAVLRTVTQPVKMLPNKTETLRSQFKIPTTGQYTITGFSLQAGVFLPVTTRTIRSGASGEAPVDVYLSGVGMRGLNTGTDQALTATACLSAVEESGDVHDLVLSAMTDDAVVVTEQVGSVSPGGSVSLRIPKSAATATVTLTTELYQRFESAPAGASPESSAGQQGGIVLQTLQQDITCKEACFSSGVGGTFEEFVVDDTIQTTIWFYAGIVSAALLLFILLYRRRNVQETQPTDESQIEMT